jgi:hypothetical protein
MQSAQVQRQRLSQSRLHVFPKLVRPQLPRRVLPAGVGSNGNTHFPKSRVGASSSSGTNEPADWQQSIARTALVGLSAAALGLALFQGRAQAAGTSASTATVTQVRVSPAAPAAAITPVILDQHNTTKEALHYRLMQLFAAPVYGKLLAVFAVAVPILALGSVLYHRAAAGSTWSEACIKPYEVLLNCPGKQLHLQVPAIHGLRLLTPLLNTAATVSRWGWTCSMV